MARPHHEHDYGYDKADRQRQRKLDADGIHDDKGKFHLDVSDPNDRTANPSYQSILEDEKHPNIFLEYNNIMFEIKFYASYTNEMEIGYYTYIIYYYGTMFWVSLYWSSDYGEEFFKIEDAVIASYEIIYNECDYSTGVPIVKVRQPHV